MFKVKKKLISIFKVFKVKKELISCLLACLNCTEVATMLLIKIVSADGNKFAELRWQKWNNVIQIFQLV